MSRDEVLAKVRKLLNMTAERGCSESEATIAAGLAQKLLFQHHLSLADLSDAELEPEEELRAWEDPLDTMPSSMMQHWRGPLASALARANGCCTLWHVGGSKPVIRIVGGASDVQAVRYMYQFCLHEIERLAGNYRGNGRTWLNNWRHGVVEGIGASLREAREAARQEQAASGTSLIVINNALAKIDNRTVAALAFMQSKFRTHKQGFGGAGDNGAREQGRRDGRSINVGGNSARGALPSPTRRLK